jgi:hypothetical protein
MDPNMLENFKCFNATILDKYIIIYSQCISWYIIFSEFKMHGQTIKLTTQLVLFYWAHTNSHRNVAHRRPKFAYSAPSAYIIKHLVYRNKSAAYAFGVQNQLSLSPLWFFSWFMKLLSLELPRSLSHFFENSG